MGRLARSSALTALLVALGGCAAPSQSRVSNLLTSLKPRGTPPEQIYTILWWAKADSAEGQPYRPREPAAPEVDPATGNVFAATSDGFVHAIAPGGEPLWEYEGEGPFAAGPTLFEGRIYAGTSEGRLVAIDAANGKQIWAYESGEELVTRPVVADGKVFVMSAADTLFAVGAEKGDWRWQYRRDLPSKFTIRGASRPLVLDGKVFVGFADGNAVALGADDGSVAWVQSLAQGASQFFDVDASPVADDFGRIFFASFATGIFCLEAETGSVVWKVDRPGTTSLAISTDAGRLFAAGAGFIGSYALMDGMPRWVDQLGDRTVSGLTLTSTMLLASTGQGPLLFLDARTGELRRLFDPGKGVTASPTPQAPGEAVVLSNRGFVYAISLEGAGAAEP